MPWVRYVPFDKAKELIDAVNNARTALDHRIAKAYLQGYMKHCEEMGMMWPCLALDLALPCDGRPVCCGEYLDWKPNP